MSKNAIPGQIYRRLYLCYGPQRWWPGETDLEIIVGAILTQNTSWSNVVKAIGNLKKNRMLTIERLQKAPVRSLGRLIRSSGYYIVKAKRLKSFIDFLSTRYRGDIRALSRVPTGSLREQLLSVNGIGPETADSILLYVYNRPVFVVDAYTKRIFSRHRFFDPGATYDQVQRFFTDRLIRDARLFNEFHALIVKLGKEYCKKKPLCFLCPIVDMVPRYQGR